MDVAPSMVQRSGDTLIVRSVVSGNEIYLDQETGNLMTSRPPTATFQCQPQQQQQHMQDSDIQSAAEHLKDEGLPQCKIKRNYSCSYCTYFTQNPRSHLTHLRDVHGEKIVINKCKLCLYASRHYQKLVRHMKMVHGSTEGIAGNHGQSRKRNINREARKRKNEDDESLRIALTSTFQTIRQLHLQKQQEQEQQQQPLLQHYQMPKRESPPVPVDDAPQNRLLKCSVCEWTTLYRAQLVDHEQEKHCRTKFFRCDKCTYVTHIKARYSKHVKYHSMPMIKCVTCDFRTPYKWNLDRHMKNHGGVGPFKCAACDFTADIKQSLTVHEMNHHVPPVGHAAGMSLARRRNKVGGTDISDDYLSDPGDQDDQFNNNNNNIDDFDESYAKKCKYEMPDEDDDDEEQPTDLSQKGGSEVGSQHNQKKSVRPVPNLIPIQAATNALNLSKEPAPSRNRIKDIAALLFPESQYPDIYMQMEKADAPQLSPSSNHSAASKRKAPSSSFFHELKAFNDESARNGNLSCSCGHVSKCLSESYIHRKSCNFSSEDKHSSISPINLTVNCSGSTRCQFCRHRCKSSADLLNHLKNCPDTGRCQNDSFDSMSMSGGSSGGRQEHDDDGAGSEDMNKHPMENRVFVWNKMPGMSDGGGGGGGGSGSCGGGSADGANGSGSSKSDVNGNLDAKNVLLMGGSSGGSSGVGNGGKNEDNSYYGVETAPGYGEVTKKMTPEEEAANSSLKKVYKCPHCSFWASTASRFHVHIVGHLNKKPFECSLCAYRSNWRWDITKHIRLKTIRDPSHKNARVLMNDETGRRNYTKYNKYITLMKVTDEDGDPKLMKSGEMTPNQVATLSFLNDFNKTASESGLVNGLKSNHSQDGDSSRDRQLQQLNQKNDTDVGAGVDTNGFGNLPLLLMNVAMAQKEQQEQAAAAASAGSIKRSPPPLIKPSDDLITDIKTDGLEKKKLYKCRKCNFRHANRDAALAHVKVHCQDPLMSFPSPSKPNHSTPLQVAVNSNNIYHLAMCLSQNQLMQEQKSPGGSSSNNNTQHSNLSPAISGSGLQQAISPKAFAAIQAAGTTIEHGEITDEASSSIVGESTSACGGVTPPPSSTVVQATSNPTAINSTSTSAPTASNTPPTATTTTTGGTSSFIGGASNSTTVVMGVTTSSNFSNDSNERREPSPFRCGHCHQKSNWKHVIQRHCRLKHSGNVLIETLDRNSNSTLYRPLGPAGNGQSCHVLGPSADPYILGGIKANHQQSLGKNTNSMLSKDESSLQADSPFSLSRQKFRRDQLMGSTENLRMPLDGNSSNAMKNTVLRKEDDLTANDLPNSLGPMYAFKLLINNNERARIALSNNNNDNSVLSKDDSHPQGDSPFQRYRCELPSPQPTSSYNSPSNKCKQQKCPSCTYICDSKSQMNYHISLHKPTQYECNLCSYVCTKRQHLNNHMKAMHENCGPFTNEPPAAIDLRSKQSHDSDDDELASKVIAYCPKCPTRFINSSKELQLHLNAHGACYDFQCEACDFSTKQEAVLLSHSFAHTSTYQEKTEQVAKSAREDPNYVARKMQQITLPNTGETVWVVAEAREKSSSFDGDGSLLKKQLETGSIKEFASPASSASPGSSSPSESGELEKCTHCPFQSTCNDTFKRHLQCHISVSNQTEKHTCEHCDFSTSSEEALAEHTQIHFESIEGRKSVSFFTSYDQLELIVTDDEAKKDEAPKPINFNSTPNDSKASPESEKSEKESASPNLRRSSRSSAHNGEGGKSSASSSPPPPPPPPPSSHKTILVNPKTGQVIRRN